MADIELLEKKIEEVDRAIENEETIDGFETEAEMRAYIEGIQYAINLAKDKPGRIVEMLLSPREYLRRVTGKSYMTGGTCEEVEEILDNEGLDSWSYCISDIDEARLHVDKLVLVELRDDETDTSYARWFPFEKEASFFICPDCYKKVYTGECKTDKCQDDDGNQHIVYICQCGCKIYNQD